MNSFGEHICVVAMGLGIDGTKYPLSLVEDSPENAILVRELLVGLREPSTISIKSMIFICRDHARDIKRRQHTPALSREHSAPRPWKIVYRLNSGGGTTCVQPARKGYTDSNPPDTTYWREEQVPQFLDHPTAHATLTEEAVEKLRKHIRAETPDDFGVKWLSVYVAVNGEGYCL